jgi:hypothetical protein
MAKAMVVGVQLVVLVETYFAIRVEVRVKVMVISSRKNVAIKFLIMETLF